MLNDQFRESSGDRSNIENVCVVITDGQSNRDTDLLAPYSQLAEVPYTVYWTEN